VTSRLRVAQAARVVRAGGIVAYPTEAVFGLGCDPLDRAAVMRLLGIKRRSWRKGLILIAATLEQLEPYVVLPPEPRRTPTTRSSRCRRPPARGRGRSCASADRIRKRW